MGEYQKVLNLLQEQLSTLDKAKAGQLDAVREQFAKTSQSLEEQRNQLDSQSKALLDDVQKKAEEISKENEDAVRKQTDALANIPLTRQVREIKGRF